MPPYEKDELKKKDEQRLDEMQREIDEAAVEQANDSEPEAETAAATESAEAKEAAENEEKDEAQEAEDPVAKLTAELKETENALKRLRADFENYRRRTTKEKEEIGAVVNQEIIKEMLPLLDNFERALSTDGQNSEKFREGVEMICKQFVEILKKNGLEPIETQGAVFDPNFHQAVMRVENPDLADDTIAAELQKGYMVKGKVIRPSMVQVVANN